MTDANLRTTEATEPTGAKARRPLLRLGAAALLVSLLLARVGAVYTENVNWDEFALLKNAARTAATGELHAGGRPGLAVLVLLPLVQGCADEIAASHTARLVWLAFTGALLLGLVKLVSQMGGSLERSERRLDALLAFALLALVPAFLEWSLQVRSDQLAIAAGLWGGVALLASRRRPVLGLLAGVLFGVGFLASQKLLYVAALVALLALGRHFLDREWRWGRESLRALLAALGMLCVVAAFPSIIRFWFPKQAADAAASPVLGSSLGDGVGAFEFYRQTIGYSEYAALLPSLVPHLLLLGLLCFVTSTARREAGAVRRRVQLAWAVLALGLAVGLFHAAAFRYFFMTLGLFAAVALALVRRPLLDALPSDATQRRMIEVGFCALLVLPALSQSIWMLQDTQSNQRESLSFIARNFEAGEEGFHPEGALFCRLPSSPFPIYFSQHIYAYFGRDPQVAEQSTQDLISDFEDRQVKFVLESWRLRQFPPRVREFWEQHYQPYRGSVLVAGHYFDPQQGQGATDFDLLVDGEYRWLPSEPRPLSIDGREVAPGGRLHLRRGSHRFQQPAAGYLVLALNEPPGEAQQAFYRSH